jgi:hypothetical protein
MYIAKRKFFDSRYAWVQAGQEFESNPHTDRLYESGRLEKKRGRKAVTTRQTKVMPEPENKSGNDEAEHGSA